jgi:spore maturation protein CgeB
MITDAWPGLELFLDPQEEILVARDGAEVLELLRSLTPERAAAIGARGRARVLAEHTYDRRAAQVDRLLRDRLAEKRGRRAA